MRRFQYNPRWPAIELGDNAVLDARDRDLEDYLAELGTNLGTYVTAAQVLEVMGEDNGDCLTEAEARALFALRRDDYVTLPIGDARYLLKGECPDPPDPPVSPPGTGVDTFWSAGTPATSEFGAWCPTNQRIYLSSIGFPPRVEVYDPATYTVTATILLPGTATGANEVIYVDRTDRIYVADYGGYVYVINPATNTVTNSITGTALAFQLPYALCYSPSNQRIYVGGFGASTVAVVNPINNTVSATTIAVPNGVWNMEWCPTTNLIYGVCLSNDIQVINPATNTIAFTFATSPNSQSIAYSPVGDRLWVTDYTPSNTDILIYHPTAGLEAVVNCEILPGLNQSGVAYSPSTGRVYVSGGDRCTVFQPGSNLVSSVVDFFPLHNGAVNPFHCPVGAIGSANHGGSMYFPVGNSNVILEIASIY